MKRGVGRLFICISVFLAVSLALTWVPVAPAQEITGAIKANIFDKSGGAVPKATVELSGPALLAPRTFNSDEAGHVFFDQVPPGEYTLTVSAPNFTTYKLAGIKLNVGKLPTFDITLGVGSLSTTVEVTASAVLVDVTTSNVSVAIPLDVVENVPKGRSFQTLIPFAPGARQEPLQSSRYDRGRANGFQIDGASDSENTYLVEGLDTSDIENGGIKQNVVFEFIQEVQVKTSGMQAEYGGATGGVVNVIQKRGGNQWHGAVKTYYRTNAFDSNDPCATTPQPSPEQISALVPSAVQINCGLRAIPGTRVDKINRKDAPAEYYQEKQDHYRIVEPGYEIGGALLKDKLWIFSSYIPSMDRASRTVNFTGATNPGLRTLYRSSTTQNMLNRLDYQPFSKVHLFAGWQYGYNRTTGQFPALPDSVSGQRNSVSAGTDPATYRPDRGTVNPSNVFNFGGDWTPNSHTVVTARYGYFYYNTSDRGVPVGLRYIYQSSLSGAYQTATFSKDIQGNALIPTSSSPGSAFAVSGGANTGFATIAPNQQVVYDIYSRKAFSTDLSYFVSKWGTHNFKVGYGFNRLYNNVSLVNTTARIDIFWDSAYSPTTVNNKCAAIIAQNETTYGKSAADAAGCRGNMGYYQIIDGVTDFGVASSLNHGLYVQDGWTLGHGLTLNLGVRFDKEYLPPYAAGYPPVDFGFGSKVAPRIGGAYDLFHNGKVKIFADYAKVFDIMKYSLPRGSFGGDYWHDCTYAMDFFDYNTIVPTIVAGHSCQNTGPSAGVTVGRFLSNKNWRAPGALDPTLKPMAQHEMVVGTDWAITPNLGLEVRYARKRLDNAIEDTSVDDDVYFITNPGNTYSNLLQRPLPEANAEGTPPGYPILCATCPPQPRATRRYDGLETRLTYRHGSKLFGQLSYTYSKLRGNYPGLVDTDISDGNGGRHSPNNSRLFDLMQMQYTTSGKLMDGPLSTDRPNVLSMSGYYQLKWWHMNTTFGATQVLAQGTPKNTCVPVFDSTSSCQYWAQRGDFANIHRDSATGNLVLDSLTVGARTPMYSQTDFNLSHEIGVSKTNEAMKLGFEWTVTNLFNQASILAYNPNPFSVAAGSEWLDFSTSANIVGTDFLQAMTGYDPIAVGNSQTSSPIIYNNRYGLPILFQTRRTMRMGIRFTF
jgi:hypothetical protein